MQIYLKIWSNGNLGIGSIKTKNRDRVSFDYQLTCFLIIFKVFLLQSILTIWILTYHDFITNQYFRDVEQNLTAENIVR